MQLCNREKNLYFPGITFKTDTRAVPLFWIRYRAQEGNGKSPARRFGVFCAGLCFSCYRDFKRPVGTSSRVLQQALTNGAPVCNVLMVPTEFLSGKWNKPVVASCANEKLQLVYKRWLHINDPLPELERDLEQLLSFWLNIPSLAIRSKNPNNTQRAYRFLPNHVGGESG